MVVADEDGDTSVEWKWYDKSATGTYMLLTGGSATVTEANGTVTSTLAQKFGYHHYIKLVVTADGVVTDEVEVQIV
jgi:hypothetical protein